MKLGDFGVAGSLSEHGKRHSFCGTPFWMAPEVINQEDGYDSKADIWSLGVCCVEMVRGTPPYYELHPMRAVFLIDREDPPRLKDDEGSAHFRDFVAQCAQKKPGERPAAKQLLRHPWFAKVKKPSTLVPLITRRINWLAKQPKQQRPPSVVAGGLAPAPEWDFGPPSPQAKSYWTGEKS